MRKSTIPFHLVQEHVVYNGARVSKVVRLGYWGDDEEYLRLEICKVKDGRVSRGVTMNEEDVRQLRSILQTIDFGK